MSYFFFVFDIYLNRNNLKNRTDDGATPSYNSRYVDNGPYVKRGLEVLWKKNVVKTKTGRKPAQRWGII